MKYNKEYSKNEIIKIICESAKKYKENLLNKNTMYYYPKTLIQDNLKNNITDDNRIIAILSKNKNQKLYNHITYLSKNVNLEILKENNYFKNLIDLKSIYSDNLKYQEKIDKFFDNQN